MQHPGHKSGRQIVELLKKKESEWSDDDYTHVKHVLAYCKRHLKQGNSKDPEHSKWRYSLMNWCGLLPSCRSAIALGFDLKAAAAPHAARCGRHVTKAHTSLLNPLQTVKLCVTEHSFTC